MLATTATRKTIDGASRENPSLRERAVAHTASSPPESTSTNHAMTATSFVAVLSLSGYGSLVRRPVPAVAPV